jgi:hypothetical protein
MGSKVKARLESQDLANGSRGLALALASRGRRLSRPFPVEREDGGDGREGDHSRP